MGLWYFDRCGPADPRVSTVHDNSLSVRIFSLSAFQHFACTGTVKPVTERAVGVNFFAADQALIGVTNSIETATASLNGPTHHDHADRHADHDHHKQTKCQKECGHKS